MALDFGAGGGAGGGGCGVGGGGAGSGGRGAGGGGGRGAGSGGVDFHVDLSALESLRTSLSALQHDVATGPAGTAAGRSALDPRVGLASSVVRANSDFVAPFAYGLLEEAAALGLAHEQVARSLATLVVDLEGLIRAIKARVASGAANYSEADASVLSAVNRAGDVDGSGYGSGSGSSTGLSSGSGHGSSSSGDWSFLA